MDCKKFNLNIIDNDMNKTEKDSANMNAQNLKQNIINTDRRDEMKTPQIDNTSNSIYLQNTSTEKNNLSKQSVVSLQEEFQDEKDEDDDFYSDNENEEGAKKFRFNQVVEDLAQYYMNEDELPQFNFYQFTETVLIHLIYYLFGPLFMPILFKVYEKNFIKNMGFWGKKVGSSHLIQIFYWLSFLITLIFTIIIIAETEPFFFRQYIFLSPAYIAQMMILIRYFTVCIKYGYFPTDYYNKWRTMNIRPTEIKYNFLLQGWIQPSGLVLDIYLKEIFQKCSIEINKFKLQCVGNLPMNLQETLREVDMMISQDAKSIRKSIIRKYKKDAMIKVKKNYKVDLNQENVKHRGSIQKLYETSDKHLGLAKEITMRNENKNEIITNKDNINIDTIVKHSKILPAKKRLQNFIEDKILPDIRNKLKLEKNYNENQINYKSDYLYEISGISLCRLILKNVFHINLSNMATFRKIFVSMICFIPFLFTLAYYFYFNTIAVENSNYTNNTSHNITNYTNNTDKEQSEIQFIQLNFVSIILLLISLVSIIPPAWLMTMNIQYGIVDLNRKKKLLEIITDLINTNLKEEERIYPLLNIMHSKTMLNWYTLKCIFMNFGKRFTARIILQNRSFFVFLMISIFISFLTIFGFFSNMFLTICLIVSLAFLQLLNFLFLFQMTLLGAQINYYEYIHNDWMVTHKLFIDELLNYPKLHLKERFSTQQFFTLNTAQSFEFKRDDSMSLRNTQILSKIKEKGKQRYSIPNIRNSQLFIQIIDCQKDSFLKLKEIGKSLIKTSQMIEHIKQKIIVDSYVRPIKILWVKSDYGAVGQLLALLGTGFAMLFKYVMSSVDISQYLTYK